MVKRRPTRKRKPAQQQKKQSSRKKQGKKSRFRRWPHLRKIILGLFVLSLAYVVYLDTIIRVSFEGKRWALPAHVYARPLELYPGVRLSASQFNLELERLGYRYTYRPTEPGSYTRQDDQIGRASCRERV